jgi:hypothetical protein
MSVMKRGLGWLPVALGMMLGIPASLIFSVISFDPACCVCDTAMAEIFFPYAVIINPQINGYSFDLSLAIAYLQWPAYGLLLGIVWAVSRRRGYLFATCVILLLTGVLVLSHYEASRLATQIVASIEYDPG